MYPSTRCRHGSIRCADGASPRAFIRVGESGSCELRGRRPWLGNCGDTQTTSMRTSPNNPGSRPELTETMLEIGSKLFPRRYHRFKDLRPDQQACEWARTLDWRQNPYDRFLLRRELLHHLESTAFYESRLNVYSFASRDEIAAEVDRLMNEFPGEHESMDVFSYVLLMLPWNLAFKHGQVKPSRLAEALGKLGVRSGGASAR